MRLSLFRRQPDAVPPAPTASDHARALGQIGRDNQRARIRAMARELCRCTGQAVPAALADPKDG